MTTRLSDELLTQLSGLIAQQIGLFFPPGRWADLERQCGLAAREFGFAGLESFVGWLLSSALGREQLERLSSFLTISETYFWREPLVFQALENKILPELIQARQAMESRRLRIWCAGCSTGEEPYSIAILLRKLIPNLAEWQITLLATDIDPKALGRAQTGVYGEWSFRNAPPGLREKNFTRTETGKYAIRREVRQMVSFASLNLAQDNYPSPNNNTGAMDLILCRNVLMYFSSELTRSIGRRFHEALVEGGWFVVSSSELSQVIFPQFTSVHFPGAIVYRRGGEKRDGGMPAPSHAVASPPLLQMAEVVTPAEPALVRLPPARSAPLPAPPIPPPPAPAPAEETSADVLAQVRALANEGCLDAAWRACEAAIRDDRLNYGLHYLSAVILQEQQREGEALAALRRAVYIEPDFVLGHFALGNLAQRQGQKSTARKSFANVLALLARLPAEELLPEAEGLTAGRLLEIVQATLQREV